MNEFIRVIPVSLMLTLKIFDTELFLNFNFEQVFIFWDANLANIYLFKVNNGQIYLDIFHTMS